ncbi:MAG TPA: serine/threonine-protein kinase, partial [Polyangiaceae bacterium]
MRAHVGSVVGGKYKLVDRLGGGGMGEVFRAEHLFAGRVVALKLLRPEYAGDADLTRRFFQEAQAVNKIRHPNIVDVLDAGFSDEGPYVAMEILEGASLAAALVQAGKFTLPLALAVVLPMLDALGAVHRQGIVHRDLKPENVFLARQFGGVGVKLVDFGIAKVHGANTRTNTGVIFGTPDYLSPEQASGEGVVDGRSDLFAVGVVLFELLTARRPFEAETALATAYRVVNAVAPKLVERGAAVDPRVQGVLDVALAKSSPDRYADAAAFAAALEPLVGEGAEAARAALLELVNAVTVAAPTVARPPLGAAATVAVEGGRGAEPLPVTPPPGESSGRRGNTGARRESPTPLAPPTAPPLAPTLASNRVPLTPASPALSRLARTLATSELREPVPSPSPSPPMARARLSTPSRALPEGLPLPPRAPTTTPVRLSPRARFSTDRRAVAWTPRPLPAHVRGKAHARGSVARAAAEWISRSHGTEARDEVLRALPA